VDPEPPEVDSFSARDADPSQDPKRVLDILLKFQKYNTI
jgi:hypothetical protein